MPTGRTRSGEDPAYKGVEEQWGFSITESDLRVDRVHVLPNRLASLTQSAWCLRKQSADTWSRWQVIDRIWHKHCGVVAKGFVMAEVTWQIDCCFRRTS